MCGWRKWMWWNVVCILGSARLASWTGDSANRLSPSTSYQLQPRWSAECVLSADSWVWPVWWQHRCHAWCQQPSRQQWIHRRRRSRHPVTMQCAALHRVVAGSDREVWTIEGWSDSFVSVIYVYGFYCACAVVVRREVCVWQPPVAVLKDFGRRED